jgi:hypothetical protein
LYMTVLECWSFRYMWGVCQHDNSAERMWLTWGDETPTPHD